MVIPLTQAKVIIISLRVHISINTCTPSTYNIQCQLYFSKAGIFVKKTFFKRGEGLNRHFSKRLTDTQQVHGNMPHYH